MNAKSPTAVPRHVAIIMDGNGRWAQQRRRPRAMGHRAGQEAAEKVIRAARESGVEYLTLFAFSSENWGRPEEEVRQLFGLLSGALERQVGRMIEAGIRLNFVGDLMRLSTSLRDAIRNAEERTAGCDGMQVNIALSFGGRWDIVEATRSIARAAVAGDVDPEKIDEALMTQHLSLGDLPDPDLFIRTGGEFRISNFLLWNLAYTELYFTECLWPDFEVTHFAAAVEWFGARQRRFGCVPDMNEGVR